MLEQLKKRRAQIEQNIEFAYDLLSEIERKRILSSDPTEILRFRNDEKIAQEDVEELLQKWYAITKKIQEFGKD